jgi:3-deoxy-manno-octulosonate cytidylyltransferase (CMP-KDO synthetase)
MEHNFNLFMKVNAYIPARMKSSRFPGKPLINLLGKPMIQHVWEKTKNCNDIDEVFIATCDDEIREASEKFGAKVIMTSKDHNMCMTRIVEAVKKKPADIIVTIQGDEPLINSRMISQTINQLKSNDNLFATTLAQKIISLSEINDPNRVKIIWNKNKEVIYISREAIPSKEKYNAIIDYYKMVCVYTMKYDSLMLYDKLEESRLENIESIDMLRIIENDKKLGIDIIDTVVENIDVPEDIPKVLKLLNI